ncbi:PREDICTED: toll-like receptor 12-like [Elephantulus edwardii]|uniref:toll-like receptor 12-like n=1 Tax=Elephantulus edwardii TaxID=28737 RepID=UPI0003F0EB26|nr:PREDICTED: toll-like receptor 12-like [Elephantulus edwardii]
MGQHLLLPSLLLFLPLATAWTMFNCLMIEGSRLHLASRYFSLCHLNSSLHFLAWCHSVTNLTQTLEAVPQSVDGLCLSGSIPVLPPDAFSKLPGLKALTLILRVIRLLPGALRGLKQLKKLTFFDYPQSQPFLYLPPDAFDNLSSLQYLLFLGPCLNRSLGVRLPPSLRLLAVKYSCLQNVGILADIFPDLVLNSSSGGARYLDSLDLSANPKLNMTRPGALQGLQLKSLDLSGTKMQVAAVMGLGLQRLDALTMKGTPNKDTLPTEVIAHFGLQVLHLGCHQREHISSEDLASCHSLKTLDLKSCRLTNLPPGFLASMPRLQTLSLTINQSQIAMLCMKATSADSRLQALNLASNNLYDLPLDTFSCLPHLRELVLWRNKLVHLDSKVFQGLSSLETLDLSDNLLAALDEGWLALLPTLTTLNLLNTQMELNSTWDFQVSETLHNLRLLLPPGPPRTLSLPMGLASLELHANSDTEPWTLVPTVLPVLQTLTLKGWSLQLEAQNVSKNFPALSQLSLLGINLEALCSKDASSFFLWQLPELKQLSILGDRRSLRPCRITGLLNLRELKLQRLQSPFRPRPVRLEELVGELPRLEVLQLVDTGVETLSVVAFLGLGSLQVLVLDYEKVLVLDSSLQEHSPQMPQYIYLLVGSLACQCANVWVEPWIKQSPRTYMHIGSVQQCQQEGKGRKPLLTPFLQSHCPKALGLELFIGSFVLLLLMISLPFLKEARNWILYLQALFRIWLQGQRGQRNEDNRFLYDVFVSHCRQDQGWVMQELLPTLEGCPPAGWGLRVCLPERDFEPGKDVADNVADSMVGSRVTLCVLSRQALCTPRCSVELHLATSLLLTAPYPPVLLLVFLEPISRYHLPRYHRLARLLRRGDYHVWQQEDKRKDYFRAWLGSRLGQPGRGIKVGCYVSSLPTMTKLPKK